MNYYNNRSFFIAFTGIIGLLASIVATALLSNTSEIPRASIMLYENFLDYTYSLLVLIYPAILVHILIYKNRIPYILNVYLGLISFYIFFILYIMFILDGPSNYIDVLTSYHYGIRDNILYISLISIFSIFITKYFYNLSRLHYSIYCILLISALFASLHIYIINFISSLIQLMVLYIFYNNSSEFLYGFWHNILISIGLDGSLRDLIWNSSAGGIAKSKEGAYIVGAANIYIESAGSTLLDQSRDYLSYLNQSYIPYSTFAALGTIIAIIKIKLEYKGTLNFTNYKIKALLSYGLIASFLSIIFGKYEFISALYLIVSPGLFIFAALYVGGLFFVFKLLHINTVSLHSGFLSIIQSILHGDIDIINVLLIGFVTCVIFYIVITYIIRCEITKSMGIKNLLHYRLLNLIFFIFVIIFALHIYYFYDSNINNSKSENSDSNLQYNQIIDKHLK